MWGFYFQSLAAVSHWPSYSPCFQSRLTYSGWPRSHYCHLVYYIQNSCCIAQCVEPWSSNLLHFASPRWHFILYVSNLPPTYYHLTTVPNVPFTRVMLSVNILHLAFSMSPVSIYYDRTSNLSIFTPNSCFQVLVSLDNSSISLITDFSAPWVVLLMQSFYSILLSSWKLLQLVIHPHLAVYDESSKCKTSRIRVNWVKSEHIPGAI